MTMTFSANPVEGMAVFAPGYLERFLTLSTGQADDLKLERNGYRYWLARCGPEDGEEWQVHVERLVDGCWVPLLSYRED